MNFIILFNKGTIRVISIIPQCTDAYARFTTVPLTALFN